MLKQAPRQMIGIAWIYLRHRYDLYKILATPFLDSDDRTIAHQYDLERVELENRPAAFRWIQQSFWRDWGAWYNGHPAIVFTPDLIECIRAIRDMHRTVDILEHEHMIPAPVAFDWTEFHEGQNKHGMVRYRYISPKRTKGQIWKMRQKYPDAGDLAFLPEDIASGKRDENGNPTGAGPVHDWTTGWAW